jgi:Zn finger protein HypA/HybF involved in hydrogenase expression
MAEFILQGKVLKIEGGNIHFDNNIIKCHSCGHMFKISISETIKECPECKSNDLFNMAGNYGHGRCCVSEHH